MSFEEFTESIRRGALAGPGLGLPLEALAHDARGDWDRAHACAQRAPGPDGAWVHAYLHRKEGDAGNAGYWYVRAGRPPAETAPAVEWEAIVRALLARDGATAKSGA